jgi:transcriptional regulator with XRE-family HTH domain
MSLDISNVNYSEVSRRSSLSLSFVSLVFRGKRRASTDATLKIAQALTGMLGIPVTMEDLHLVLVQERNRQKQLPEAVNG